MAFANLRWGGEVQKPSLCMVRAGAEIALTADFRLSTDQYALMAIGS
jgi:hypothetical protein